MSLTLPQPPRYNIGLGQDDDKKAIRTLYDHVRDLHRALKDQLDQVVGGGGGGETGTGSGSITEQLGVTIKPGIVAQCYDVTARFGLDGYPTDRNGLLEYFNPGNAGVAFVKAVELPNINTDVTPLSSGTPPFVQTSDIAVEFRAVYHAAADGLYIFAFDLDGVGELLVDGTVIVSKYANSTRTGGFAANQGVITLVGGFHSVIVHWLVGTPGASPGIQVGVKSPTDVSLAVIGAADLGHYTGGLEAGAPTNAITCQTATTTALGGTSFITSLPFTYTQPAAGGSAKLADGFILYFDEGSTSNPVKNQEKIGVDVRVVEKTWPKNKIHSYAIATYRKTENGEEVGPKATDISWQGIVSTAPVEISTNPGSPTPTMNVGDSGSGGGNLNINSSGAVTISGATVTIQASGTILITGGRIHMASGQPIELMSVIPSSPARIVFLDVSNNIVGIFDGLSSGGNQFVRLIPQVDKGPRLQLGIIGSIWGEVDILADGFIDVESLGDVTVSAIGTLSLSGASVLVNGSPISGGIGAGGTVSGNVSGTSAMVSLLSVLSAQGNITDATSGSPATVSGSRADPEQALKDLLTQLTGLGFITDTTTV